MITFFRNMSLLMKMSAFTALGGIVLGGIVLFANLQIRTIGVEIAAITQQDIPLTNMVTKVTVHQLEQAVAVEQALGAGYAADSGHADAKALTKAHIDTLDQLKAKAPWGPTVGLGVTSVPESGLCGLGSLKYHAGAVAAWEEAGHEIPDCAKP